MELRPIIESILFASPRGLSPGDIKGILKTTADNSEEAWIKKLAATRERAIEKEINAIASEYEELRRTYQLRCISGKWQFHSNPEFSPWLQVLLGKRQRPPRLTQPALETLSIIAYRQPITRAGIEKIRGVSVDGVIGKLMERGLIEENGKSEMPGKPALFGTTEIFLEYFGLPSLLDLPDAGTLKSINADPDAPLEAPPESLHSVTDPDELSEWGIENTLELAPNEPPEDTKDEDVDEEFLDDEDDDEEFIDDEDDADGDESLEYASRSAKALKEPEISATEEDILNPKAKDESTGDEPNSESSAELESAQQHEEETSPVEELAEESLQEPGSEDGESEATRGGPLAISPKLLNAGSSEEQEKPLSVPFELEESPIIDESEVNLEEEAEVENSQVTEPESEPEPQEVEGLTQPDELTEKEDEPEAPGTSEHQIADSSASTPLPGTELLPDSPDKPSSQTESESLPPEPTQEVLPEEEKSKSEEQTIIDGAPPALTQDLEPIPDAEGTEQVEDTIPTDSTEIEIEAIPAENKSISESQEVSQTEDMGDELLESTDKIELSESEVHSVPDKPMDSPKTEDLVQEPESETTEPEPAEQEKESLPVPSEIEQSPVSIEPENPSPPAEPIAAQSLTADNETPQPNQESESISGKKPGFFKKFKQALNSIEDPTNPVQFISLCTTKIWQTLNTIAKKLTSWIKK